MFLIYDILRNSDFHDIHIKTLENILTLPFKILHNQNVTYHAMIQTSFILENHATVS